MNLWHIHPIALNTSLHHSTLTIDAIDLPQKLKRVYRNDCKGGVTHIREYEDGNNISFLKALLNSSADNSIFYCIVTVLVFLSFFNIFISFFCIAFSPYYNTHTHTHTHIINEKIVKLSLVKLGFICTCNFINFFFSLSCLLYIYNWLTLSLSRCPYALYWRCIEL